MNLIYSFIGVLPDYIIESIYQTRLYYKGDIYLILNDYDSPYLYILNKVFKVILIKYEEVIDKNFLNIYTQNIEKIMCPYASHLKGRELLFSRSYEKLFIINNLIKYLNLKDCLVLELDVLIYSNPELLIPYFHKKNIKYTATASFDNHYCVAYMYIKDNLDNITDFLLQYMKDNNSEINEMKAIYSYHKKYKDLYLLPVFFKKSNIHMDCWLNYDDNDEYIFDGSGHGIILIGRDTVHKKALNYHYIKETDSSIKYKWMIDKNDGLKKPYLLNTENNKLLLIHNLHIHSKNLKEGLSI